MAGRFVAAALMVAAIIGASAPTAGASGSSAPGQTESSLQIQAQELAGQIQADGQSLDRLDEAYNAALLRSQSLKSQLVQLEATVARTNAEVQVARQNLKQQAILSYIAGGGPIVAYSPGRAGADPSLTVSYADIIAGGQQQALKAYKSVLALRTAQTKQVEQASQQSEITLTELTSDRAAVSAAMTAREQALDQVKGRLAVLVADVEIAQQKAARAAAQASLAAQHQSLPSSPVAAAPTSPSTASSGRPTAPSSGPPQTTATTRPAPISHSPPPTSPPTTTPPAPPPSGNYPAKGSNIAVAYAYAQIGKPYQWGGAGPGSFDCSGLTMMAWAAAGVSLPHLAQGQYDMTRHIPLSDVLPGDLIFFGTPSNVYHVGISIGGGEMIDAPSTGLKVSISSIYWSDLLGAGRIID